MDLVKRNNICTDMRNQRYSKLPQILFFLKKPNKKWCFDHEFIFQASAHCPFGLFSYQILIWVLLNSKGYVAAADSIQFPLWVFLVRLCFAVTRVCVFGVFPLGALDYDLTCYVNFICSLKMGNGMPSKNKLWLFMNFQLLELSFSWFVTGLF